MGSPVKLSWRLRVEGEALFYFLFLGLHLKHMQVPWLGVRLELHLPAYTQPQQCQIWATSATYTTAHGNVGSLTQ